MWVDDLNGSRLTLPGLLIRSHLRFRVNLRALRPLAEGTKTGRAVSSGAKKVATWTRIGVTKSMSKKPLLPCGALAAGLLAFASSSFAGILNIESGPTFAPQTAFTDNTITVNTTVEGGLIALQGTATITPPADTNTVSIDLSGNYSAEAGEKFSLAYSFSIDLNLPEPVAYQIAATVDIGGVLVPVMGSGTLMPGLHKYEGSAEAPAFMAPDARSFTTTFQLTFSPTGSALLAAAGTLDLDLQQLDFKLDPLPATVLPPSQPLNLSTRGNVGTGEDVLIAGFIITGQDNKQLVLRAIGPSLPFSQVDNPLADPEIELLNSAGTVVATNDNWMDLSAADRAVLTDNNLAPTDPAESALVATLAPGKYTAIVTGVNGATGVALVEAYDLDNGATDSKLANISTRSHVTLGDFGDGVMIGGFIVGGGGFSTTVIRGLGPSLADAGITNFMADPEMELFDANGEVIDSNDNWMDDPDMQQISDQNLAPANPKEAALFEILPPGMYTVSVLGVGGATGVALVEVYNVDDSGAPAAK